MIERAITKILRVVEGLNYSGQNAVLNKVKETVISEREAYADSLKNELSEVEKSLKDLK